MNHPQALQVAIIDDDEAVRDSLGWLLEAQDYSVNRYQSAEDFLQTWNSTTTGCLILDIRMPGMTGIELHDLLVSEGHQVPVIFITGHGDVPMAVSRMKKGAVDFLQKPFSQDELRQLVEQALAHARGLRDNARQQADQQQRLSKLTTRETQVLERIVAGRLNKQIADDLDISIKTVEAHRANIMEKLGARTMADLMKIALSVNG
jgi:FixJ family two-component response regulator